MVPDVRFSLNVFNDGEIVVPRLEIENHSPQTIQFLSPDGHDICFVYLSRPSLKSGWECSSSVDDLVYVDFLEVPSGGRCEVLLTDQFHYPEKYSRIELFMFVQSLVWRVVVCPNRSQETEFFPDSDPFFSPGSDATLLATPRCRD